MKIISGGQTGVDRTALEVAKEMGLETGGFVPKGWKTENGPDPSLKVFGCVEHPSSEYPPRTFANVKASDGTVWFGSDDSRGLSCTYRAVEQYAKPFLNNPTPLTLRNWIKAKNIRVLNVAGNRGSKTSSTLLESIKTTLKDALREEV